MKWLKLPRSPFPEHLTKEERKMMRIERERLNVRSWRIRVAVAILIGGELILYLGLGHFVRRESPVLLLALLPGVALIFVVAYPVVRRNTRTVWLDHHICPECGYDMRASPDRCPECGFQITKNNASTETAENTEGTEEKAKD